MVILVSVVDCLSVCCRGFFLLQICILVKVVFHEFVRKLVLILNNPKDFLEYFVVKPFVVMEGLLRLLEGSKGFGDGDEGILK